MTDRIRKKDRSQNARRHGNYAKRILFPWDDVKKFNELLAKLIEEHKPTGRTEEEIVFAIAKTFWDLHSLWEFRQTALLRDPFTSDIVQTGGKSIRKVRKMLRAQAKDERALIEMATQNLAQIYEEANRVRRQIEQASDPEERERLYVELTTCLSIA